VRVRMGERLRMTAVCKVGRSEVLGGAGATSVARPRRKMGLRVLSLSRDDGERDMAEGRRDGDGLPEMDRARAAWLPCLRLDCRTAATMTLNLVSNSYLEESTAKIRVKQVPWEVRSFSPPSLISSHRRQPQSGISTRRTYHPRGARTHQESRQTT
jgi:hypothetical protein